MPEHTTPWQQLPWALASPTQGSAEKSQGMQTEFYFLKRIDLEISLGLGKIGHHLMKSVWGWSSTIFLRLLLKRPLPDTRITSETSGTVIKNQNQPKEITVPLQPLPQPEQTNWCLDEQLCKSSPLAQTARAPQATQHQTGITK